MSDNQTGAPPDTDAMAAMRARVIQTSHAPSVVPMEMVQQIERARLEAAQFAAEIKRRDAMAEETKATLAKLTEQVQLSERERAQVEDARRAEKIAYEVKGLAAAAGAVDPDDVHALTAGQFTVADDGRVVLATDPKVDAAAHLKVFLEKKPHLVRGHVARGAGSSPFLGAAPSPVAGPRLSENPQLWLEAELTRLSGAKGS